MFSSWFYHLGSAKDSGELIHYHTTAEFIDITLRPDRAIYPRSFYVHASLMKKMEKRMNEIFPKDDWEMYDRILQVGTKSLEMYLIVVSRGTEKQQEILSDFITSSQYSFPLEENPTVFLEAASFNVMEKFIRDHKLKPYILKTEEQLGISTQDVTIKVVTFNKSVNKKLDIIEEWIELSMLHVNLFTDRNYYYMAYSFPWERAPILRRADVNDHFCYVFPIILKHLGTIRYKNELNIFDLLSLRLAIYDVSDPFQANYIKSEIDFLIKRELSRTVKNHQFDIFQYFVDKNCTCNKFLRSYLIYEFQDYFKTVDYNWYPTKNFTDSISLKEETAALDKIRQKFNVDYNINGIGFDQITSSLFFNLIECPNVLSIELDTNYQWIMDAPELDRIVAVTNQKGITVRSRGDNIFKLADDCIGELKRFEFPQIRLELHCGLDDYKVLDNLVVKKIDFSDTKIDVNMLQSIHQCVIKSPLSMEPSSLENSWQTWELLNNLEQLHSFYIQEDEETWLTIFEFIIKELNRTNSKEFKFKIKLFIEHLKGYYMHLHSFKFSFDDQVSKLEIRNAKSNDLVDLFYQKCKIKEDEEFDYEFYQ